VGRRASAGARRRLCGILESSALRAVQSVPYRRRYRFGPIGFTSDERQIRLCWFRHFRLD